MSPQRPVWWGDRPVTVASGLVVLLSAVGLGYGLLRLIGALSPLTIGVALAWVGKQSVLWLLLPWFAWIGARLRESNRWSELRVLVADVLAELEGQNTGSNGGGPDQPDDVFDE